jgi:hypothetical protein
LDDCKAGSAAIKTGGSVSFSFNFLVPAAVIVSTLGKVTVQKMYRLTDHPFALVVVQVLAR